MTVAPSKAKPWHNVTLLPDPVYDMLQVKEKSPPVGLSASSIGRYLERIRRVRKQFDGIPLLKILCQGSAAVDRLQNNAATNKLSPNTLTADVGAVLAAVKHGVSERTQHHIEGYVKVWQSAHRLLQDAAQAPFDTNMATSQQRAGFVPYTQLCDVRDKLGASQPLKLWLAMATMIPCQRAGDLANCRVFVRPPSSTDTAQHGDNYVVLATGTLHLHKFKTAMCYPDGITILMPVKLCAVIVESIKLQPREFLFVKKDGSPYGTRKTFTTWLGGQLKRGLNNGDATAQLVRRAYITEAHARLRPSLESSDPASRALAKEKQQKLAHCCAHSISTHKKYRLDLDDGDKPVLFAVQGTSPLAAAGPVYCSVL